jgi:hypothetical protein
VCLHQHLDFVGGHKKKELLFTQEGDDDNKQGVLSWEIAVRMWLSLIVNAFYRTLILLTLPASLASCTYLYYTRTVTYTILTLY